MTEEGSQARKKPLSTGHSFCDGYKYCARIAKASTSNDDSGKSDGM